MITYPMALVICLIFLTGFASGFAGHIFSMSLNLRHNPAVRRLFLRQLKGLYPHEYWLIYNEEPKHILNDALCTCEACVETSLRNEGR
jgi:hypothetical protein